MSFKARSTLTSKGQVTLPVELRRRWNLQPGDCVDFCLEDDGRVVLRKWLRRSILEAREQLAPLSRPAESAGNGNPGSPARKPRP
jgi:AbrB family looped-hinge helix DNA binding protein